MPYSIKKRIPTYALDCFMVFLNLAGARGNILLFWLFGITQLVYVLLIVVVLDFLYLVFRFKSFFISNIGLSFHLIPIYLTISLLLVNYYNSIREGAGFIISTCFFLLILFFSFIIGGLIKDYSKKNLDDGDILHTISRGYIWLSLITICGIFISFFFDIIFGLQRSPIEADFLESNIEHGSSYYRSFFSVLIQDTDTRVPFFQEFGILTGLFHEPQVATHNIFPCLFLLWGFSRNKNQSSLIIVTAMLFILFSGSVTNMLVVAICLLVYFFVNSKSKLFGLTAGAGIIVLLVLFVMRFDTGGIMQDFVLDRLDSDNRSQLYSISMLVWTFSPSTILGNNFMDTDYVMDIMDFGGAHSDVGFIPCFLFIGYIVSFFINTIRLLSIDNKKAKAIGLASLYFIIHSSKIGMPMLILTLPILLVFLQYVMLESYGRSRALKKNM